MNNEGTEYVNYYFHKNKDRADKYTIFTYAQLPTFSDDLATFAKIVQSANF